MNSIVETEFLISLNWVVLAVLWIWIFLQKKQDRTITLDHIMLLILALAVISKSLYNAFHSYSF